MTNKENYLWDKSQPVDDEILKLEKTLSILRYKGEAPKQIQRTLMHRWKLATLAIAASIILAIGVRMFVNQPIDSPLQGWEVVAITDGISGMATTTTRIAGHG